MKKELICVICPKGCPMVAEIQDGKVISVTGNTCPRGKAYAENEITNPVRTLTTTMKANNGQLVSVRSSAPLSKDKLFDYMDTINRTTAKTPIEIGDVLIYNIDGNGSDIIATKTVK